jgi:hypothetical protein
MVGLLIDGSDHLVGPLGLAAQTCGCGIGASTAVGDEGEFVQRFRRIGISAMEQHWQRRKRRLACRNKLIPSHPPNKNKLFHHSCTQASHASLDLTFDVRSSAQGDFWAQSQSRSSC